MNVDTIKKVVLCLSEKRVGKNSKDFGIMLDASVLIKEMANEIANLSKALAIVRASQGFHVESAGLLADAENMRRMVKL